MTNLHLLISAGLVVFAYVLLANRLIKFGARFRRSALRLGDSLLENPKVPDKLKSNIEQLLLDVPTNMLAWSLAILIIPASIMSLTGKKPPNAVSSAAPYYEEWDEFTNAVIFAGLSNSPAATILFIAQIVFASFIVSGHEIVQRLVSMDSKNNNGNWFTQRTA